MATVNAVLRGSFNYESPVVTSSGSLVDSFDQQKFDFLPGSGTAAAQCDLAFRDAQSITGSAVTYTLSALPNSAAMARVVLIYVQLLPGTTGTLAITPGATHGWTKFAMADLGLGDFVVGYWKTAAAAAVVSGTTDQLTFTATGLVNYRLALLGRSA